MSHVENIYCLSEGEQVGEYNIYFLPKELIIEIFSNLSLKNLINMESSNKSFRKIIRETKWNHSVRLKNITSIEYVIYHYQFIKYDFSNSSITDTSVKLLGKCHQLDIRWCKQITDESVKHLGKCHRLNLNGCNQITDESVKHLGKCHQLDLRWCNQITDESVKHLGKCHTLDLSGCDQITDESVKLLGNCHTLDLYHCDKITDESVKLLGKCHTLDLTGCNQITNYMKKQLRITVKELYT